MAWVGYARVSSVGQSLEVQLDKLKHCDKLYQEKKSGALGRWPQLKACLEYIREGDTLVVARLDRLVGREKRLTVQQVAELRDRRDQGALIKALIKEYDLSKANVYRYLSSTIECITPGIYSNGGLGKNTQDHGARRQSRCAKDGSSGRRLPDLLPGHGEQRLRHPAGGQVGSIKQKAESGRQ
jgi:DNA invertase Pin-like site-specific DNA recombinase